MARAEKSYLQSHETEMTLNPLERKHSVRKPNVKGVQRHRTISMDSTNKITTCPICGGDLISQIPYLNITYAQHEGFQDLQIAICDECGLGMAVPEISYKEIQRFYQDVYRGPRHSASPVLSKYSVNPRALSQWLLLKTFKTFERGDTFLDIGSGAGVTFETAQFLKLPMQMFAYEVDKLSVERLKELGVKVFQKPFYPSLCIAGMTDMKFSCIILSHVLEHFSASESLGVLHKIKTMLSDKGIFLCEVPNSPMKDFGKLRTNDSPHLTFWTKQALAKAIESAGMQILFLSCAGEIYQDCYHETIKINNNNKGLLPFDKSLILDYCPKFFQNNLRYFYRLFKRRSVYEILISNDFQYGEDRVYLRAVCSL